MFNTFVPLDMGGHLGQMGHWGFGPVMMLPGLLLALLAVVVIISLLKHGRVGPVRWDPRHQGGPGSAGQGQDGPGRRPGPPWAEGPWGRGPWAQPSPEEAALATLADRLAKGEISPEEYLERSTALRGGRQEG